MHAPQLPADWPVLRSSAYIARCTWATNEQTSPPHVNMLLFLCIFHLEKHTHTDTLR